MKKAKKVLIYILIVILISTATFFIGRQIGLNQVVSSTSTTIEEVTVGTQDIKKTLTSSGEIDSATTEKLSLSTSKYYKTMCVEEDDIVEEGENILKYSNGTYLTAPYDCVVVSYSLPDTGEKATSDNYVEIKDLENLTTTLSIDESEINSIELDKEVEITLTADTTKTYTGKITKINQVGTYNSSGTTFSAVVSFENDGNAKIGMSVSCTINISELTDVIAVPINAVQINGSRKYVIVVDESQNTSEVDVETGLSDDEYVEIKSGLQGGEKLQVTTTTTQSTAGSSEDSEDEKGFSMKGEGSGGAPSGSGDFQMPSGGSDMQMPSGGMPSNN